MAYWAILWGTVQDTGSKYYKCRRNVRLFFCFLISSLLRTTPDQLFRIIRGESTQATQNFGAEASATVRALISKADVLAR